ncbi:MAG: fused MFS/spermidine synthase [Ignavibacteriales bacterium]|nr:fused MFS/spermidine synthase [Ignavibacteriales bacterium]
MRKPAIKIIVSLLFVISGIAGLIYQIVWFKYLSLFLGNTTYAQMTVLAAFLGGLAFGNYLFGKKADSLKNPVMVYSLLELFIGVYCLVYPTLSLLFGNLFLSVASGLNITSQNFLFTGLRFLIAAFLLFAPTTAMGGTLPVLSRFFVDRLQDTRKEIAILYFLNSFGAVIGVVFAGFVLIKEFGLNITIYSTAALNILAGLTGLIISRQGKNVIPEADDLSNKKEDSTSIIEVSKKTAAAVVLVAGISGMAALIYEMVWVRLLINFFGSSTYAFSLMLMAFIGGITLGSFIVSQKFINKFNYVRLLTFIQTAIAVSTMIVLLFYERLPYLLWQISSIFSKSPQSFEVFLLVEFMLCFLMMVIPTLFMGMALPVASEIISVSNKKIGFSVGRVFSVNTLGTVLGVILTALVFIPFFGIKGAFEIGIALNLIAAIILSWTYRSFSIPRRIISNLFCVGSFILYLILFSSWNESVMIKGVFKSFGEVPPATFNEFSKTLSDENIIFYEEGTTATVAVTQSTTNPDKKRLIINGKPDASTYIDMPTQVLLGQIPMMLHPNPKNVFVVGFGSGTTIGSVLTHPVKNVTCAEISKEVIKASKFFEKENLNCTNDSRLKLVNEDAITLLSLSKEKYDVIISEPSNPWIAGIGNLFSKEYFKKCFSSLDSAGIMVQWFHLYEANDEVVRLVLNTFASVFPNAQLWNSVANDIILVGYKNKPVFNSTALQNKFGIPGIHKDFERIGISNLFTFLSCQSSSPRGFFAMASESPINSEIHPLLEFIAPKSFYVGKSSSYVYSFDEKFDTLSNSLLIKDFVASYHPTKDDFINAIEYNLNTNVNNRFAYGLSKYLRELYPTDYKANLLYSKSFNKLGITNSSTAALEKLIVLFPDSAQIIKDYNNQEILEKTNATSFLKLYSIKEEASAFIKTTKPDSVSMVAVYLQLAKIYLLNGEYSSAENLCARVEKILRENPSLIKLIDTESYYYYGAVSALYRNDVEKVIGYFFALTNLNRNFDDIFHLRRLMAWQISGRR